MMEPPLRPISRHDDSKDLQYSQTESFRSSRSSIPSKSPLASTSNVSSWTPSSTSQETSLRKESWGASPYGTVGQLSYAPATQTTVVTTTTTTTTSFPPLLMKAPRCLHELDPKLYPLASTPTPPSIKRFCFDLDGKPTFFKEEEDPSESLQQVRILNLSF